MPICPVKDALLAVLYLMYYKSTCNQTGDWTLPSAEFRILSIVFKNVLSIPRNEGLKKMFSLLFKNYKQSPK